MAKSKKKAKKAPEAEAPVPEAAPSDKHASWYAGAVSFAAGACLMVLEITASRVLAPEFGNTVFLWSGIIGMILAALTIGYQVGGMLAERGRPSTLVFLSCGAGATVAIVPLWSSWLLPKLAASMSPASGALVATGLLFFVPSVLIGALSPVAVKVVNLGGADAGRASGHVSALGAMGSILGTFGAGFFLLPFLGTKAVLAGVAAVLAAIGVGGALYAKVSMKAPAVVAALVLVPWFVEHTPHLNAQEELLHEEETFYHRVRVTEYRSRVGRIRQLDLDSTREGARALDSDVLPFWYTRFIDVARVYLKGPKRAAFVGGGAFTMPIRFSEMYPDASIDVYELDPKVVEMGVEYFELGEHERVRAVTGDARRNLRVSDHRYDFVFGDAYNGVSWIPFHLATKEFYTLVAERMTDDGVYMSNVISSLDPKHGAFFYATVKTLREVFGHVQVYGRRGAGAGSNLILVASRKPLPKPEDVRALGEAMGLTELTRFFVAWDQIEPHLADAILLTDDYAPVEAMLAGMF
ncbi:MAG: fused MFS/spermidine synthase [Deltaproteobacteria bacterium]